MRPRLFERLDWLQRATVIWVVGSPGSGKTTLASTYATRKPGRYLWYQLDVGDAQLATFFHYFRLAVQQAAPDCCWNLPPLTPEYLPGLATFIRRYAETIASSLPDCDLIVLDNYEQVPPEAPLHEVLRELACCLPPEMRVLVLSRTEPPPAFARLRLHGELARVDGAELNLTLDEAQSVTAIRNGLSGEPVPIETIGHIFEETKGWIAGFSLLLADSRYPSGDWVGPGGTQQVLFDYFAAEFFERFPPAVQHALLCTSLLPVMTPADACELTGNPAIAATLADLQRRNCFVVQCGQREPVYEYHALFRAFLTTRAAAQIPADEWRAVQRNAARLLVRSGQAEAAAKLFVAVREWTALAALVTGEGAALISAGRHQVLEHWLTHLPSAAFDREPWLCYWSGIARLPFDATQARTQLERAYGGFRAADDPEGLYSAWAGIMDTFFYAWEDLRPADRWIAEFEALRAAHPEFPSRAVELKTYWAMGTLLHRQPHHPFVPVWAERAEALLSQVDRELSVLLGGYLVIWHLWRGDAARARALLQRLAPWTESAGFPPLVSILWSCAVGLYHSVRGELDACLRVVEGGLSLARETGLHCWDFLLCAQVARCSLVAGDPGGAERWIASVAATMRTQSPINGGFLEHLRSNALAQTGEWYRALEHARKALTMALESGVPFLEAHCRIDLARALIGTGDSADWPQQLRAAYAIGQGMGSKVLQYLCLEAESHGAFARGDVARGEQYLAQALACSREMGEPIWLMAGPATTVRDCERALSAGIEIQHVRSVVRRDRLTPSDPAEAPEHWPWPVRIHTLGRFRLFCDDEPLRSSRKAQHKPLDLIKILCAFGGDAVHQDRITDALWPDATGDAADQVLKVTLHRLRKLLPHEQVVQLEDRHLSLNPRYAWVDALAFDRAARRSAGAGPAALERVLMRYEGAFLEGESAPWALAFRERLRGAFFKLSERLGSLVEQQGDWRAAIDCYRRVIEVEPLAEAFHRRLMACLAQHGQRAEALVVYRRCRQVLISHLGVSPTRETEELYRALSGD